MNISEVAVRYAKAFYSMAEESKNLETLFNELRALNEMFESNKEITEFFSSPLVSAKDKATALNNSLKDQKLSDETKNFLSILAKKNRLEYFPQIVSAFEQESDEAHGVVRGVVRSAVALGPDQRQRVEDIVAKATKKRAILSYSVDPSLIGGLVAEVGSYTFDDTIESHLRRLNEDLKRRAH